MIDSSSETDPHKPDPDDPSDPERLDPTEWLANQFATRAQPVLDPSVPLAPAASPPAMPSPFVPRPELVSPSRGSGPARGSAVDPFPPALPEQLPSTDTYFANVGGQLPPVTAAIAVPPPAMAVPPPVAAVQEPETSLPQPRAAEPVPEPDVPPPFQWGLIPGGRFDPGQDVRPADLSGDPLQAPDGGASPPVAPEPERLSVVQSLPIQSLPIPPVPIPAAPGPAAPAPRADSPSAPALGTPASDTPAPDKPIFSTSIEPAFRSPRRAGAFPPSGEAPQGGYPSSPPSALDDPGHPAPPLPPIPAPSATSTLQPWGTPGSGFPSSPPTQDPGPPRAVELPGSPDPDESDAALPASRPEPPSQEDAPPARPVPPQSLFTAPSLVPSRVDQSPLPPAAGLPAFVSRDQVQVSDVPTQAYRFERPAPPDAPVDPVLPAPVSAAQSVGAPVDDVPALPAHEGEEMGTGEARVDDERARDRTEPSGLDALFGDTLSNGAPPAETGPPRGRRSARPETAPEERQESTRQESVWPGPPVRRPEMPVSTGAPISSAPDPGAPDARTRAESTPALSAPDLGAPDPSTPTARTRRSAQPVSTTPVSTAQKVLFGVCLGVVLVLAAIVLFLLVARPANASPGATPDSSAATAVVSTLPALVEKPPAVS